MENEETHWELKLKSYHKALDRLAEIVNASQKRELNDFEKDGLIQRFEFTHEVAWKLMKSYAEFQGFQDIGGSRDATRKAFEMNLISESEVWMAMIRSRNETSHNYDGEVADSVVTNIVDKYYPLLLDFYQKMQDKSANTPDDIFSKN